MKVNTRHTAKKQRLLVISDLHLASHAGSGPPIWRGKGAERLAAFFHWAALQHSSDWPVHLVLNGDVIDFLAEPDGNGVCKSFTADEELAVAKLKQVLNDASLQHCFARLAEFVRSGAQLTVMMGNHDLELSLPAPRRELLARLGPGRVEFVGDNEALAIGPVLLEHGNRYDGWNIVDHDGLRAVRSALSRGELAPRFHAPPGSDLVVHVLNQIKESYPFIDMLKPENEAVLPLLYVLAPEFRSRLDVMHRAARLYLHQRMRTLKARLLSSSSNVSGTEDEPWQEQYAKLLALIPDAVLKSSQDNESAALPSLDAVSHALEATKRAVASVSELENESGEIGFVERGRSVLELWLSGKSKGLDKKLAHLLRALRYLYDDEPRLLLTNWERDVYLSPARTAAGRGFNVIVYGHTHLLKSVDLGGGAVYLNTGTWADLMFVPPEVLGSDLKEGQQALTSFALSLIRKQGQRYHIPSYAQIDIPEYGNSPCNAELRIFTGADSAHLLVRSPSPLWNFAKQSS